MMFLWIIPILLIPFGFIWLTRHEGELSCCGVTHAPHGGTRAADQTDLLEIARVRLARGEITVAQFDEIRRALGL